MQITAGIVTFNPEIRDLENSVPRLLNQVEALVIADNGSRNLVEIESLLKQYPQVVLLENQKNIGVAAALNRIFRWAVQHDVEWVLTLDDDSEIPDGMVTQYQQLLLSQRSVVGIVCPLLKNRNDGVVFHSKRNSDECITSGSLTNVSAWKEIGGFDDWLFIDGVDFDFSRRLVRAGFTILECEKVVLPHQIGDSRTLNLIVKHPIIWDHAPFRHFYIQRNTMYIDFKLGVYSYWRTLWHFMNEVLFILVFEHRKKAKISQMFKGRRAGLERIAQMRNAHNATREVN